MVHTSDGAVLLAWERSCTFLLFLWGAEHSRDQITSQSPVERTIKASAGQGEIYIKLTYLGVSFFFTAGAFLSRHTIWPLEPCTWLTRRTDNTFRFCTLCLCLSPEVAPGHTPCGVSQHYHISIWFLRGPESLGPRYPFDCDALDYLLYWTSALFHQSVNILHVFLTL